MVVASELGADRAPTGPPGLLLTKLYPPGTRDHTVARERAQREDAGRGDRLGLAVALLRDGIVALTS